MATPMDIAELFFLHVYFFTSTCLCFRQQQAAEALCLRSSVRLSVCPSVVRLFPLTLRAAISLFRVEGFQWNVSQMFITRVGIAEKVFKVRGQRSRSEVKDQGQRSKIKVRGQRSRSEVKDQGQRLKIKVRCQRSRSDVKDQGQRSKVKVRGQRSRSEVRGQRSRSEVKDQGQRSKIKVRGQRSRSWTDRLR